MFIKKLVRLLFHFVDAEDYDALINTNEALNEKNNEIKRNLSIYEEFEKRLPIIMRNNKADLVDVQISKKGELLYILHIATFGQIFILSPYIVDNAQGDKATMFPYLIYTFFKKDDIIKIDELHTDSGWHNSQTDLYAHEDKGYGTALLEALVSLAIRNGFNNQSKIKGELSYIDAQNEKRKKRRNMFYHNRGFDVRPDLETDNGSIYSTIGRIVEKFMTSPARDLRKRRL